MPKPQIVLALATGRPMKNGVLPKSLQRFAQELAQRMPAFEVRVAHSENPRLPHAWNNLIEEFRNHPGGTWFVCFDPLVQITPDQLVLLLTAGKAVCGALFSTCTKPAAWEAAFYPDLKAEDNGLLAVPELAFGAKVYHRSVFDAIEKAVPDLAYMFDNSGNSLTAFCQETLLVFGDYKRLLSPSGHLDYLCRKLNIGIYAHTGVIVKRRNAWDDELYPVKEPLKPWLFVREKPPVCAEELPEAATNPADVLVLIQYCDKDRTQAERLLERIQSWGHARVSMVYSPGDQYPAGPNNLALAILRSDPPPDCKAVMMIEPDCCPLTPDWLAQLSADWDRCADAGKLIMGSWHPVNADHPLIGHLNGNLMFSPNLAKHVTIPNVPDDKPWDTHLADVFAPYWARTGLIRNLNRHKTATRAQMLKAECGTKQPVLVHGVRDESAWNLAEELCVIKSSSQATEKTSSG